MKLFSVVIYLCLILPLCLNAMESCVFKREIHDSQSHYYPIFTSNTYSSRVHKPAPRKTVNPLQQNEVKKENKTQKTD